MSIVAQPVIRDRDLLDATLAHLRALVAFDTRNPPRAIGTDGIFDYLRSALPGFDVAVTDLGAGSVAMLATRGAPKLLFNVHLDTVPAASAWSADPFDLRIADGHAVGLGACDIKGAAAGLVAAANATAGGLALLFTTDEEGSNPRCVAEFLKSSRTSNDPVPGPRSPIPGYEAVIVAEPTRCEAVLAHRGIQSVKVRFQGHAGHASRVQRRSDSALHQAVRWGAAALDYADDRAIEEFGGLAGLRFNLGRIEGGIKPNMIAGSTEVRFGMRPLPSMDMDTLLGAIRGLADPAPADFAETFRGAPLPAAPDAADAQLASARSLAARLGVPVGAAVDFWTEAALFSAAGCTTFVYGPGDIAQAHAADEWVELRQLRQYAESIVRIVAGGLA